MSYIDIYSPFAVNYFDSFGELYMKLYKFILPMLLVGFLAAACSSQSGAGRGKSLGQQFVKKAFRSSSEEGFQPLKINTVAVMAPVSDVSLELSDFERLDVKKRLISSLEVGTNLRIQNLENPKKIEDLELSASRLPGTLIERALFFGQELGVQGVLFGILTRYTKPPGKRAKSFTEAGAGFRLWLLDVKEGKVVWNATYERQQEPLTDNLLKVRESLQYGLRYRSREELLDEGFRSVASALEELRSRS
jgi:hypothetical protein